MISRATQIGMKILGVNITMLFLHPFNIHKPSYAHIKHNEILYSTHSEILDSQNYRGDTKGNTNPFVF